MNRAGTSIRLQLLCGILILAGVSLLLWYQYSYGGQAARQARSADPDQRLEAIRGLRGKGNSLALRTLRQLCDDGDARVAAEAVRAIGSADTDSARQLLLALARQAGSPAVRGEALAELGNYKELTQEADLQAIIAPITDKSQPPEVRAGAVKAVARLRAHAALPALLEALGDDDEQVRALAIVAVQKVIAIRFQFDPGAPKAARDQQVAAIRAFLKEARRRPASRPGV
jgi:HEAT repeat protein